jgi:hypothetical protein
VLASQVTGWMLATQARAGCPARPAFLAALADERAGPGEVRNACAATCLAEGDPAGALGAVGMYWTAQPRLSVTSRSWRLSCWPASPSVSP